MPGARDKIIINDGQFKADARAMRSALKAALVLAVEAEQGAGQKPLHQTFTAKQEAICDKLDKAMARAVADQRALNDELRRWIDEQLGLNKP